MHIPRVQLTLQSHTLGLLRDQVHKAVKGESAVQNIVFVWSVRTHGALFPHIKWRADMAAEAEPLLHTLDDLASRCPCTLTVQIYCTSPAARGLTTHHGRVDIMYHRADVRGIVVGAVEDLDQELRGVAEPGRGVYVGVCGVSALRWPARG